MSSPSEPQPPVERTGRPQPTTQEIPVAQPAEATPQSAGPTPQPAGATAHPAGATAPPPLPRHPGAVTPPPVAPTATLDAPQPTGPVDYVPGLRGAGTPPPPPPVAAAPPPPPAPAPAAQPVPVWPETLESDLPAQDRPAKERRLRASRDGAPRDRTALAGLGLVALALVLLELGLALDFGSQSYWSVVPLWSAFATVCAVLGLLAFAAFYPAGNRLRSGPAWRVAASGLIGLAVFWLLVVLPVVDSDRGFVLTAALAALGGALWIGPRRKD